MNESELERAEDGVELAIRELGRVRPRVVGPGRRERELRARIIELEISARAEAEAVVQLRRELSVAERIERGSERHCDRLERHLDEERERSHRAGQAHKRLLLALGAVQRENELLRERVAELAAPAHARLPAGRPKGWIVRWLGRVGSRRA